MYVRIYETDLNLELAQRQVGWLVLQDGKVAAKAATADDEQFLQRIIDTPIWVQIDGEMRTLSPIDHPEGFLLWLHREYSGSAIRASRAEETSPA